MHERRADNGAMRGASVTSSVWTAALGAQFRARLR
jgi:hypothetical protein